MKTAILNGLLVDPANKICSFLNILIENGKILRLAHDKPDADRVIDASGRVVCPGFIDCHVHEPPLHSTHESFDGEILHCMLRMGVTSVLAGNCGEGVLDPHQYLSEVNRLGVPVNIGMFMPHLSLRKRAGAEDRYAPVYPDQLEVMKQYAKSELTEKLLGISFGVRYVPGMDALELRALSEIAFKENLLIAAHIRDDAENVFSAFREMIALCAPGYGRLQISHIGSMAGFGQMNDFLSLLDQYRARGYDVMADCYPYTAFSTTIGAATYDPGFLQRYQIDYSSIEIAEGPFQGKRCTKELFDTLRKEAPHTITIAHVMRKEDVLSALQHPAVMVASDGFMHGNMGHPRASGTFPKAFSMLYKGGTLSLCSVIEKFTALPARRFCLNKGELSMGADADIVVLDPDSLQGQADYKNPLKPPTGIDYVFVNGQLCVENGRIVNALAGKAIYI